MMTLNARSAGTQGGVWTGWRQGRSSSHAGRRRNWIVPATGYPILRPTSAGGSARQGFGARGLHQRPRTSEHAFLRRGQRPQARPTFPRARAVGRHTAKLMRGGASNASQVRLARSREDYPDGASAFAPLQRKWLPRPQRPISPRPLHTEPTPLGPSRRRKRPPPFCRPVAPRPPPCPLPPRRASRLAQSATSTQAPVGPGTWPRTHTRSRSPSTA